MSDNSSLKGRIALVTGATGGIGSEVCLELARRGAKVIATSRQATELEKLDDRVRAETGDNIIIVPMDLRKHDGIDNLGGQLYERFGKLDIFVGNAGVLGPISPVGHIPPKKWDELMTVNLTANFRFIRSFDVLFRQSDAARLVFISSGVTQTHKAFWGGYSVTKAGLEMLAFTYAEEMANTSVKVNCVNPGPMRTKMRAEAMPGEDPMSLPTPDLLAPKVVDMCAPTFMETGTLYNFKTD